MTGGSTPWRLNSLTMDDFHGISISTIVSTVFQQKEDEVEREPGCSISFEDLNSNTISSPAQDTPSI